jgi:predicted GNAT superfamily acetyltransferase
MQRETQSVQNSNRPARDGIIVRRCGGMPELQACMDLERKVWGFLDVDVEPLRTYVVAIHVGGHVIGAFSKRQLVGFVMGLPGVRQGRPYLYSRVLAVHERYRNAGVGRRLKLFQRQDALSQGFDLVEWTFDPLEIKNAFFNLERLGAIAGRYRRNQYGTYPSRLQGGLPSDRLIAEWWLRSPGVVSLLDFGTRGTVETNATIVVPGEIDAWKASKQHHADALKAQTRIRKQFLRAFSRGMIAAGFERDEQGNGKYLLVPCARVSGR